MFIVLSFSLAIYCLFIILDFTQIISQDNNSTNWRTYSYFGLRPVQGGDHSRSETEPAPAADGVCFVVLSGTKWLHGIKMV